ncbi:hypothetical protein GUITHDRAFT_110792 [Guillardia theta CCMP2712]|uniref:Uncharacterized protein n=1 Tax=Guillardia theta (strain CCMP2712) TaxID=905079 RepID=L1J408_GUITC|nr:hypothetical protein GUITHDRAFT_110792 [Guillardia theta CCMP2712]EKX43067.1 hypothetical protein GUITHDRAFT_110792 [Guillardia theta CCMP2712]|eukprot:XP_005830047.1 hypothetical protein GUITHDRAFT_110792 [Guillardia theta CCMP2712]
MLRSVEDAKDEERRDTAEQMKRDGNVAFKAHEAKKALGFYARGIAMLESKAKKASETSSPAQKSKFECGSKITMAVQDGGLQMEGIVSCVNGDGTYDIMLDCGDDHDNVPESKLRLIETQGDNASTQELLAALYLNAARCMYQLEQYAQGAKLATKSISCNPTNGAAFFVRGRCRLGIPTLDDARADLRQAVASDSGNAEFRNTLAECQRRIKDRNESNRETARMFLNYCREEGISAPTL